LCLSFDYCLMCLNLNKSPLISVCSGSTNRILVPFKGPFFMQQLFPSLLYCIGLYLGIVDKFTFLLNSLKMQFNQTYVPKEASVQVNKRTKHIHDNQALPQNCSPFPDCPAALETLLQRESVEKFQQETEQTVKYLYSKGNRCSGVPLSNRRERIREKEHKRQTRLRGALNVFRSVIPDYFLRGSARRQAVKNSNS